MQIFSPLEQFEIVPIFKLTGDLFTITNSTVFGLLAVGTTSFFLYLVTTQPTIVPNRWQSLAESLYSFVFDNCIKDVLAEKGNRYFLFIFTTFLFIKHSSSDSRLTAAVVVGDREWTTSVVQG